MNNSISARSPMRKKSRKHSLKSAIRRLKARVLLNSKMIAAVIRKGGAA